MFLFYMICLFSYGLNQGWKTLLNIIMKSINKMKTKKKYNENEKYYTIIIYYEKKIYIYIY
jgi:hypothetical protein